MIQRREKGLYQTILCILEWWKLFYYWGVYEYFNFIYYCNDYFLSSSRISIFYGNGNYVSLFCANRIVMVLKNWAHYFLEFLEMVKESTKMESVAYCWMFYSWWNININSFNLGGLVYEY